MIHLSWYFLFLRAYFGEWWRWGGKEEIVFRCKKVSAVKGKGD